MKAELIEALLGELLKIPSVANPTGPQVPFLAGQSYFIQTVTYHYTGRVKKIIGDFIILDEAAWIASEPRLQQFLAEGQLDEVEPIPDALFINMNTVVAAYPWKHELPRTQS